MTELDDLRLLREQLTARIKRSSELLAAGQPERYLTAREKVNRLRVLANMDAAILKLEGH